MSADLAWITGGGSGVGAATALALAAQGHPVAVSGRRHEPLDAVVAAIRAAGGVAVAVPLDVTRGEAVDSALERLEAEHGHVGVLVASAGANTKRRFWGDLDRDELARIVEVNLTSVAQCVAAVLPGMLRAGSGQVIVVSSRAARIPSPGAGVGYRMSKAGLRELVLDLNAAHHTHGVRASLVMPGDIATDFLDQRPDAPDADARSRMLTPDDVARAISFVAGTPTHVRIDELAISPVTNP